MSYQSKSMATAIIVHLALFASAATAHDPNDEDGMRTPPPHSPRTHSPTSPTGSVIGSSAHRIKVLPSSPARVGSPRAKTETSTWDDFLVNGFEMDGYRDTSGDWNLPDDFHFEAYASRQPDLTPPRGMSRQGMQRMFEREYMKEDSSYAERPFLPIPPQFDWRNCVEANAEIFAGVEDEHHRPFAEWAPDEQQYAVESWYVTEGAKDQYLYMPLPKELQFDWRRYVNILNPELRRQMESELSHVLAPLQGKEGAKAQRSRDAAACIWAQRHAFNYGDAPNIHLVEGLPDEFNWKLHQMLVETLADDRAETELYLSEIPTAGTLMRQAQARLQEGEELSDDKTAELNRAEGLLLAHAWQKHFLEHGEELGFIYPLVPTDLDWEALFKRDDAAQRSLKGKFPRAEDRTPENQELWAQVYVFRNMMKAQAYALPGDFDPMTYVRLNPKVKSCLYGYFPDKDPRRLVKIMLWAKRDFALHAGETPKGATHSRRFSARVPTDFVHSEYLKRNPHIEAEMYHDLQMDSDEWGELSERAQNARMASYAQAHFAEAPSTNAFPVHGASFSQRSNGVRNYRMVPNSFDPWTYIETLEFDGVDVPAGVTEPELWAQAHYADEGMKAGRRYAKLPRDFALPDGFNKDVYVANAPHLAEMIEGLSDTARDALIEQHFWGEGLQAGIPFIKGLPPFFRWTSLDKHHPELRKGYAALSGNQPERGSQLDDHVWHVGLAKELMEQFKGNPSKYPSFIGEVPETPLDDEDAQAVEGQFKALYPVANERVWKAGLAVALQLRAQEIAETRSQLHIDRDYQALETWMKTNNVISWTPGNTPFQLRGGVRQGSARLANGILSATADKEVAGTLALSPTADLNPGRYEVEITYTSSSTHDTPVGVWNLLGDSERVEGHDYQGDIYGTKGAEGLSTLSHEFERPDWGDKFQVQVDFTGTGELHIHGIKIRPVAQPVIQED